MSWGHEKTERARYSESGKLKLDRTKTFSYTPSCNSACELVRSLVRRARARVDMSAPHFLENTETRVKKKDEIIAKRSNLASIVNCGPAGESSDRQNGQVWKDEEVDLRRSRGKLD